MAFAAPEIGFKQSNLPVDDGSTEADDESSDEQSKTTKWLIEQIFGLGPLCLTGFGMLVAGTLAGMLFERWSWITALYVTAQIVTTVGYGDFIVSTPNMQLFFALFALSGVVIAAYVINKTVEKVNQRNADLILAGLQKQYEAVGESVQTMTILKRNRGVIGASAWTALLVVFGTVFYAITEPCTCGYGDGKVDGCVSDSFQTCSSTGGYTKTWGQTLSMSVITLTTIGFGTNTPRSKLGRIVAVPWMLLGVAGMAHVVGQLQHFFFERHQEKKKARIPRAMREHFVEVAVGESRDELDRSEYRAYRLLLEGMVTTEQIQSIDAHFEHESVAAPWAFSFQAHKTAAGAISAPVHVSKEGMAVRRQDLSDDEGSTDEASEGSPLDQLLAPLSALGHDPGMVPVLLVGVAMLAVGTVAGMLAEGWSWITALYVTAQIVTTVGYGDFTVKTGHMQVLFAVYALAMVVIAAYVINIIVEKVNQRNVDLILASLQNEQKALAAARERSARMLFGDGDWSDHRETFLERNRGVIGSTAWTTVLILFGTVFYAITEPCTCGYGDGLVDKCVSYSFETCSSTGGYVKSWTACFCMSVITLTTVGFGDHTPRTELGRLIAVPWMLVGVASMAQLVGNLQHFLFERDQQDQSAEAPMATRESYVELCLVGADNKLNQSEYRTYKLLLEGMITTEQVLAIDAHFDDLASTAGPDLSNKLPKV